MEKDDAWLDLLIGSYRIRRIVGRGGMAVVYEAVHEEFGHRVAIKRLLLPQSVDVRRRVLREGKALAEINHPGVVRVYDCLLSEDGSPALIMEYVEGRSLRALLDEPLAIEQARRFALQLARALTSVHARGVIHRDLKPDNVMLVTTTEQEQAIKLVDFGLARLLHNRELVTKTEDGLQGAGTPVYMPPEQWLASASITDKTDIYAFGVMFYEMLCGTPPFVAPASALRTLHRIEQPPDPRLLRPEIPAYMSQLVLQMLSKRPARRPSAVEVERALTRESVRKRGGTSIAIAVCALIAVAGEQAGIRMWHTHQETERAGKWPGMVLIPKGEFLMGSSEEDLQVAARTISKRNGTDYPYGFLRREIPQRQVRLSGYYMDRTEVSNDHFASWINGYLEAHRLCIQKWPQTIQLKVYLASKAWACPDVLDGNAKPPRDSILLVHYKREDNRFGLEFDASKSRFIPQPLQARWPALMVTWDGAQKYCEDHGKTLPSEAQYEYAARGSDRRNYPFGNIEPNCHSFIHGRSTESAFDQECKNVGTSPVPVDQVEGLLDISPFGVLHLAGNVAEWQRDSYMPFYLLCPAGGCVDPVVAYLPAGNGGSHVVRGGRWDMNWDTGRSAGRSRWPPLPEELEAGENPASAMIDIGFRCVIAE